MLFSGSLFTTIALKSLTMNKEQSFQRISVEGIFNVYWFVTEMQQKQKFGEILNKSVLFNLSKLTIILSKLEEGGIKVYKSLP